MKFRNDKGKIFGVIHYFDLLVLLLVLVVAFAGYKYLGAKANGGVGNDVSNQNVEVQLYLSGVRNVTSDNLKIGDVVKVVETNKVLGTIVDKAVSNKKIDSVDGNGNYVESEVPNKFDVILTVEGEASITTEDVTMGNKIIKIGNLMRVKTQIVETTPVIYGIDVVED